MATSQDAQFPLSEVKRLGADREPCPVCGHPTGDCTPVDYVPPNSTPLLRGQISQVKTSSETPGMVLVDHDVIGERQITPFTVAKVILATKGSYVTVEKAQELGLL